MSFKQFLSELNGERVEGELLKTVTFSLLTSFIILIIAYYYKLSTVENFIPKYGFYLFFAMLSYAVIIPSIRQVRAYKQFNCMSGMMIGMTVGMEAGFLAGYLIGATNGMFYGGVFGMLVGIILGIWTGLSCGVMGFMEGIMAGFMGGLMGAMTSVMLLNDNLKLMTPIVFVVCSVILFALNYMIYTETREHEHEHKESQFSTILISAILMILTIWLMVLGPRSSLFS